MLLLFRSLKQLNFSQLMQVYSQSNQENAADLFSDMPQERALAMVEEQFYCYLREVFFKTQGALYWVWQADGNYVSALRTEPYQDGYLLEGLETSPKQRRKGYGHKLLQGVLQQITGKPVYSHVGKNNAASLALHRDCGFGQVLDFAVYIDGSVSQSAVTLKRAGQADT